MTILTKTKKQEGLAVLKGVNRKVVEIQNPESIYFEKVVFYLKPNLQEVPLPILTAEAQHCIYAHTPSKRRALSWRRMLLGLVLVAGGAVAAWLLLR